MTTQQQAVKIIEEYMKQEKHLLTNYCDNPCDHCYQECAKNAQHQLTYDWLMPVAKKVCGELNELSGSMNSNYNKPAILHYKNVRFALGKFDLPAMFDAVVDGIRFVNETKK